MTAARALFASPAAARALVEGRTGVVQMVLSTGAYLTLGEDWAMVVDPEAARHGPLSLAVHGTADLKLEPGMTVRVARQRLIVDGVAISLARMRERPLPADGRGPDAHPMSIRSAVDAAIADLPPVDARLQRGVDALAAGALAEAAVLLAGAGDGLTPAGDDVLAGYAGWHAARSRPLKQHGSHAGVALSVIASDRCSPLGLAYLRCAERAELPAAAARLVTAIRRGSPREVSAAVRGLRRWGASSGTALGTGIAAAAAGGSGWPRPEAAITAG